jgi:site-specific DNA-methyltransferase (adenine-specific)
MLTNVVYVGDCVPLMQQMQSESVDLIFADPPFNIGYRYDQYDDRKPKDEYLRWADRWLAAAIPLLKTTGSFWLAIGDDYVAEYKVRLDAYGLTLRNWIIWHYTFGVACTRKFSRSHTHILYYVRDPQRCTFDAEAVRVPSARQTTYSDRRANPRGKLPDDVWVLRPQHAAHCFQAHSDTWYIPRLCGTFRERTSHPCQMPEAILERIIRVASQPGDLVFDPFAGSGTTLVVAKRLKRRFIGIELSQRYVDIIHKRLQQLEFHAIPQVAASSPSLVAPQAA